MGRLRFQVRAGLAPVERSDDVKAIKEPVDGALGHADRATEDLYVDKQRVDRRQSGVVAATTEADRAKGELGDTALHDASFGALTNSVGTVSGWAARNFMSASKLPQVERPPAKQTKLGEDCFRIIRVAVEWEDAPRIIGIRANALRRRDRVNAALGPSGYCGTAM